MAINKHDISVYFTMPCFENVYYKYRFRYKSKSRKELFLDRQHSLGPWRHFLAIVASDSQGLMITIRPFEETDWPATWRMMEPVVRAGETYSFAPDMPESEAHRVWVEIPAATFVALDEDVQVVGTYYIKPNQPGLGDHVCNCGYIVSSSASGKGIASQMCEHSQNKALELGFSAMQYNLVVSTNERAVRLWQRLGFSIVGTIPKAFRHLRHGLVDAHVMFKQLRPLED